MSRSKLSSAPTVRQAFRIAMHVVAACDPLEYLEARLVEQNLRPGRPRGLTVQQLMTLLLCMALTDRPMFIERVPTMLQDLSPSDRHELGLQHVTSNQVEYLYARMARILQPDLDIPDNTPGKVSTLNAYLDGLLNGLMSASTAVRPDFERGAAIDGTRVASRYQYTWGTDRTTGKKVKRFSDRDTTFHVMPTTDDRGNTDYKDICGYGITAIVNTPLHTNADSTVPMATEALAVSDVVMAYTQAHVIAAPMVERIGAFGGIKSLVADNGYYHHPDFPDVVRQAGIDPVMPLHTDRKGVRDVHRGVVATADTVVCPATPSAFLDIKGVSGESLERTVEKRGPYELVPHGKRKPDGSQRFSCPAVRGKVRCPLVDRSMRLSNELPTVKPPQSEHAVCTQKTITLPGHFLTYVQTHSVGTETNRTFMGYRQRVESSFAQLKSRRGGGLSGDTIAVRSLAKTAVLYGVIMAAENVMRFIGSIAKLAGSVRDAPTEYDWLDTKAAVWLAVLELVGRPRGDP